MSNENASAAPTSDALAGSTPVEPVAGSDAPAATDSLYDYFLAQETGDVDNSTQADDSNASDDSSGEDPPAADADADAPEGEEAPADEAEGEKSDDTPADDADPAESTDTDEELGNADFAALEGTKPSEFLTTVDDIKGKFARNADKNLVAMAAEYGAAAKAGTELLESIGGPRFVPGIQAIASALQSENPARVFDGIVQTNGIEGLAEVLGQATYMGLISSQEMLTSEDPVHQALGKATRSFVEGALQERYGEHITLDRIQKMAQYDKLGWFDKIDEWVTDNYVKSDELDELLEATNDPKYAEIVAENRRLKQELEGDKNNKQQTDQNRDYTAMMQAEQSFGQLAHDGIEKSLSDVVWKTSVLRDAKSDSAELKAEKEFIRNALIKEAVSEFDRSEARQDLLKGYRQGQHTSAAYQDRLTKAIEKAILATRVSTSRAEAILARAYGRPLGQPKTPPASSTPDPNAAGEKAQPLTPSAPSDNGGGNRKMTSEEIFRNLEQGISDFESGRM